jgi:hypothetical protein
VKPKRPEGRFGQKDYFYLHPLVLSPGTASPSLLVAGEGFTLGQSLASRSALPPGPGPTTAYWPLVFPRSRSVIAILLRASNPSPLTTRYKESTHMGAFFIYVAGEGFEPPTFRL